MKTKCMKKTIGVAALCSLGWGLGLAQNSTVLGPPVEVQATATCGTDTVRYPLVKALSMSSVAMIKGDIEGIAQYYELPSAATLNGVSFRARIQDNAGIGKTANVTVRVYMAGPDSLPQGIAVSLATVQVDTHLREWKVPLLAPLSLSGAYLVAVEYGNGLTENDTLLMELNGNGNGMGESLGAGLYNNLGGDIWLDFEHLIPNADRDAMIFPWLSYSLTAGFSLPGDSVCVDEPLQFTNASTPLAKSRMYNRRIQDAGTFGNAFNWSFGDGTTMSDIDPIKTYTVTGSYSVLLTAAIQGYTTQCSEPIASAIVVMPRPTAMFVSSTNSAQQHDSITFTSMSSNGTCVWDFGDGSPVVNSCSDQVHVFDSAGTFIVTQTVNSAYGCMETYTDTVQIQMVTSVSLQARDLGVRVWPNPAASGGSLHMRWDNGNAPMDVKLFDLNGRLLSHQTLQNRTNATVDVPTNASGILILQMEQDGLRSHHSVVVSR